MADVVTELFSAMASAFAEIEGAQKDSTNPHFMSKYADLSSVVAAIKPALAKHGLWFRQACHERERGVCVETFVCHKAGHEVSFGSLFVPASKQDAQGFGSALTYARRYGLMTAFGVCPEDDDGSAASRYHAPEPLIDDATRDEIAAMASGAGVPLKKICDAYGISNLKELPASAVGEVKQRIQKVLEDKKNA